VPLTPPSILLILWASYNGVQVLGEQFWSDRKAHLVTGVYVVAVLGVVARLENGGGYGLFDFGWFGYAGDQLAGSFLTSFQATLAGGIYLWWRGYRLARSRIRSEQVLHSFIVGLVGIILGLLLRELASRSPSGVATGRGVAVFITAAFFFAALFALALSHIRRISADPVLREEESPLFSHQWLPVLLGVAATMVLVGWLAALLFSFNVLSPILHVLSIFGDLLLLVGYYVVILPLAYLAAGITYAIEWFLGLFGPREGFDIQLPGPPDFGERERAEGDGGLASWLLLLLRWSLVTLAISLVLYLLVRLLLRYRHRRLSEDVVEIHESVGSWKDVVRDVLVAFFWMVFWLLGRGRRLRRGIRVPLLGTRRGPGGEAEVRELYRRLLAEARAAGFPKRIGETPSEYLATLERHLPTEREALERLTQDYATVRYGEQPISQEETGLLNRLWRSIYGRIQYYLSTGHISDP